MQNTLSIIKPDAVKANLIGEIYARFEKAGLKIVAAKMLQLTPEQAADFYAEHLDRPFYPKLQEFMLSGPVMVQVLQGKDAIALNRELMGATENPDEGTIRADYATNVTVNCVHGSDSPESASREIAFFFAQNEIFAE